MNSRTSRFDLSLLVTLLFLVLTGFSNPKSFLTLGTSGELNYKIRPASHLEINGKTNINSFCCSSREKFQNSKLIYQVEAGRPAIRFQNTVLKINSQQLDCGHKGINRDMRKALMADQYPEIIIDLKEVYRYSCKKLEQCDVWMEFEATTEMTITCETHIVHFPVQVKKLDDYSFRIVGGTALKLCDFAIKTPTALMGLIKVQETIEINFDLYVDLY